MRGRAVRRMAGLLAARLPELGLEEVPGPRAREGRWSLAQILQATLLGLMAGCRSLSESEDLSASLALTMRRRLGLPRRLAATTARDALCRVLSLGGLRAALHRAVKAAWRRKALAPVGLPVSVLALYRSVTLRSDEGRATRWKSLLQSVRDLLVAATEDQLAGLRQRQAAATR